MPKAATRARWIRALIPTLTNKGASAQLLFGAVEELDNLQAVGAGGLCGGEVGGGQVAGIGRESLVELAGALRLP